jgi:hypothetical protein
MNAAQKLSVVKILHTVIWVFYNIVIGYLVYAVWANVIDEWVWVCLGLILVEGIILLVFRNICPVTLVARKYSHSQKANFDIYLPNWLARYNKEIYSIIVLSAIIVLIFRLISA